MTRRQPTREFSSKTYTLAVAALAKYSTRYPGVTMVAKFCEGNVSLEFFQNGHRIGDPEQPAASSSPNSEGETS